MPKIDESKVTDGDIEWAERVHKAVVGLAAIAECNAEACDPDWMGMQYSLENLADICKSIVADFRQRLGKEGGAK